MYFKTKVFFFILYTCRNIHTTIAIQTTSKYDISETIRSSINLLFQNVEDISLGKFIKQMESHNNQLNHRLGNELILNEIHALIMGSWGRKFNCNFLNNELRITISRLHMGVDGSVRKDDKVYLISMLVNFEDLSIHMVDALVDRNTKLLMDISYSDAETNYIDRHKLRGSFWYGNSFTDEQRERVKKSLKSVLPDLILNTVKNNDKFTNALNTSVFRRPKKDIISTIPNFLSFEEQYYYFIRQIQFPAFDFRNITIRGLSNFQSFKSDDQLDDTAHVLTIKNIRGNLILDYTFGNLTTTSKSLGLDFTADYLIISVNSNKNRVNVQARDYKVIRNESDTPLSFDQSAMIMHHIESAIASSIMRFKTIWWRENQSSTRYDNEDRVRQTLDEIANKKGPYDYQISFHNVTVKLISGIPYPQQIHCEFPNNLNITHRINAKPIGNLRLNNERDSTVDINFHVNFTSISFSIVNPNNSKENDTCEFQIYPNEDIKVEFLPTKNASVINNEDLEMKMKIDQTLISMTKERFTSHIKPVICSPFNFCAKSANVVNDYLLGFIKKLLNKCSLGGITTR